ncbi:hypothetical protein THAOC_14119 [Thalassiosira oceanica]|uniref:Uncharacterized protein n=1 Tax=Thalassiosira oceanica TaxID=159749 RepID=K0SVS2_THAOC|nr:hypothetical protein THAOC_14119 [Thalassiosira oceanica]|eukprot:EJK65076.1 hypothetical protein THAOC_14119 [Thalassiosira oceanica]
MPLLLAPPNPGGGGRTRAVTAPRGLPRGGPPIRPSESTPGDGEKKHGASPSGLGSPRAWNPPAAEVWFQTPSLAVLWFLPLVTMVAVTH